MIYRNLGVITDITTTLDTHLAYQIFFASFWLAKADQPPPPFTTITADHVAAAQVRPNPPLAKRGRGRTPPGRSMRAP